MSKKNIYFFGCSQTAGDELADNEFFPWKLNCKTRDEYYRRKQDFFLRNPDLLDEYLSKCKEKSYPNLISHINSYNFAHSGSSLKSNVINIINLIEKKDKKVDLLFFQIPPRNREFYLNDKGEVKTLRLQDHTVSVKHMDYIKIKLITHGWSQQSIEDLIDIILINNYLNSKSIEHFFIDFTEEISKRVDDIPENFNNFSYLINFKLCNLIDLSHYDKIPTGKLLGYHFNEETHSMIAEELNEFIKKFL